MNCQAYAGESERRRWRSRRVQYAVAIVLPFGAFGCALLLRRADALYLAPAVFALAVAVPSWSKRIGPGVCASSLSVFLFAFSGYVVTWSSMELINLAAFSVALFVGSYLLSLFRRKWVQLVLENGTFRNILEWAPIGIVLFGLDRSVKYANAAVRKMYGLGCEEILAKPLPLPDCKKQEWNLIEEDLRMGKSFRNIETTRVRKDGSIFHAVISGAPLFDDREELAGLIGIIVEAEIHPDRPVSPQSLHPLVEGSSDFLLLLDLEQRTLYANPTVTTLLSISAESVRGKHILEFFAPEDHDKVKAHFRQVLSPGSDIDTEPELRLRNPRTGRFIPVLFNIYVVGHPVTEAPSYIACIARDISAEAELHARLRYVRKEYDALLQSAPVPMALVRTSGQPFASNKKFQEILGYTEEEVTRTPFAKFVHPDDLPSGRQLFLDLAAGRIDHYETEKRLVHKQGSVIWTMMSVTLMRDREGKPSYSISAVQPLSEQSN